MNYQFEMDNPLDHINALPIDIWNMIAFNLPFEKLQEYFDKVPQQKDNIQFWKGRLNHDIQEHKKK